ncbi:ImmA/IrrE family metallo-endopeptidase [Paracoccus liaowanqingii]|uniref:ImmA/IrrE family metallo-endopeptidase n=1 Tax=Paracoccus liaowanqingii TaxID=2560053 RepID=A0A4Z1CGS1_9RHOB|nr:ImmA/IrrE family metallo-endopeptidase [Paracoccus liaowanqingii]TGN59057.1 ImmA/IrrE family metallo-endopeptidase [Paracoccus liaowanqingii]
MARAEFARVSLRERQSIEPYLKQKPVPLGRIAQALGLQVLVSSLPAGVSGKIEKTGDNFTIRLNRNESRERQRFTLAHEIAHFLLHKDILQRTGEIEDTVLYRSGQPQRIEFEANRLAADLIMPDEGIESDLRRLQTRFTEEAFDAVASEWQVSKAALEIKLGPVYS